MGIKKMFKYILLSAGLGILRLTKTPFITIRLDIIDKCNLRCKMCMNAEENYSEKELGELNEQDFGIILKDIHPYVKTIMLSCGYEPLLSKNFIKIVHFIRKEYPHIRLAFCTNAMFLDAEIRKLIFEKNISEVYISLDGATKETFEKIRCGADYNKIISNLKALCDLKKKHHLDYPTVSINTVVMNSNLSELPSIVKIGSLLEAHYINFRNIVKFNKYFETSGERLQDNKDKFNFFRDLAVEEARRERIRIIISNKFNVPKINTYPEKIQLSDFLNVKPDENKEIDLKLIKKKGLPKEPLFARHFHALMNRLNPECRFPFNEMLISYDFLIKPCPCYRKIFGVLTEETNLAKVFFGKDYNELRKRIFFNLEREFCLGCEDVAVRKNS